MYFKNSITFLAKYNIARMLKSLNCRIEKTLANIQNKVCCLRILLLKNEFINNNKLMKI